MPATSVVFKSNKQQQGTLATSQENVESQEQAQDPEIVRRKTLDASEPQEKICINKLEPSVLNSQKITIKIDE